MYYNTYLYLVDESAFFKLIIYYITYQSTIYYNSDYDKIILSRSERLRKKKHFCQPNSIFQTDKSERHWPDSNPLFTLSEDTRISHYTKAQTLRR